jgi:putative nucleotidyltransferase with HDIG domain
MSRIDEILSSIKELPPFPEVARKVMELIQNPKSTPQDIVKVIQYDGAMTSNVLRMCNSAYFGLSREIDSLQRAVMLIGYDSLSEIVLANSAMSFYRGKNEGYDLGKGELWRHSVACALLSQILLKMIGRDDDPLFFTAALIHDVGKIVLSRFVKEGYLKIMDMVRNDGCSFVEAEERVVGIDHAALGGRILQQWQFPDQLIEAVRCHHQPDLAASENDLVGMTYLADVISLMMGIGVGADGLCYKARDEVMTAFNLKEKNIEMCMVQLWGELGRVEGLLSVSN